MFDAGIFWSAFAAVGMLKTAYVDGSADGVQVGLVTPDMLELDAQATGAEYQIEFQTSDLSDLARGTSLTIDTLTYRVRRPPRRTGDGFFSVADLELVK